MTFRSAIAAACAGLALTAAPAAAFAASAIQFVGVGGTSFTSFDTVDTIGWGFTANADLSVTKLGWFVLAPQLNGFHQVGIWDVQGGLLGSATVLPGPASADGFRYVSTPFTPFTLAAGKTYVIGGVDVDGDGDRYLTSIPSLTVAPEIAFLGAVRAPLNTTGLVFPNQINRGVNGRIGPTFQFDKLPAVVDPDPAAVPEAATWAVMIVGFGLAGAALRRRTVRVA